VSTTTTRDVDTVAITLPAFPPGPRGIATRDSSGQVLNAVAQAVPWLAGGSADQSPSTKTRLTFSGAGDFQEARTLGWDRYVADGGAVVGMHTFGASAPLKQLLVKLGFTPDLVAQVARHRMAAAGEDSRAVGQVTTEDGRQGEQ
jgi:transketolase